MSNVAKTEDKLWKKYTLKHEGIILSLLSSFHIPILKGQLKLVVLYWLFLYHSGYIYLLLFTLHKTFHSPHHTQWNRFLCIQIFNNSLSVFLHFNQSYIPFSRFYEIYFPNVIFYCSLGVTYCLSGVVRNLVPLYSWTIVIS